MKSSRSYSSVESSERSVLQPDDDELSQREIRDLYGTRHIGRVQARSLVGLMDFFCFSEVEVVALSSYEEKEEQFKEQVASLRQRFYHSIAPGGLAGDRHGVVPASGFAAEFPREFPADFPGEFPADFPAKILPTNILHGEVNPQENPQENPLEIPQFLVVTTAAPHRSTLIIVSAS